MPPPSSGASALEYEAEVVTPSSEARPPPAAPPPPGSTQTAKWGLPLAVVVIGMFMSVLDTSIVNVAIPTMQKEFGSTDEDIQWVTTAYTLCLGVIVPTSAWLGERMGLRRLYLISLLGFSAFSALCGMAGDLNTMVAFRILQAIPGGVIPVTCLTLLYRLVPKEKLGTAMGMYGFGVVVAPGVGPCLGGYLVDYVDWRLIFFINVPIGILGALAAMFVLPKFEPVRGKRFDLLGFGCIAAGLFALLLAVSEGQDWGWTSYEILLLLVGGTNLLALFVVVERHVAEPLLDVRAFTILPFVNALSLLAVLYLGLFAVLYYVPIFLQQGQHITAMNTGWVVLPQALVMVVMMPLSGRLYDRFGGRWLVVIGLLLDGIGTLLMVQITADMTRPELMVWMMIRAAGLGLAMMPVMTSGLSSLPASMLDSGSTFTNVIQRVSAPLGLAALTAMVTAQQAQVMSGRSALLPAVGANVDPRILDMQKQGPGGLIPLWQQLQVEVQAETNSNVYLLLGASALVGALFAFFLPHGRPEPGDNAGPVEV